MSARPLEAENRIKPNPVWLGFFTEARRLAQLARDREDARIVREIEEAGGIGAVCAPWRYHSTREQYEARGLNPFVTPEPGRPPQSGPIIQERGMK